MEGVNLIGAILKVRKTQLAKLKEGGPQRKVVPCHFVWWTLGITILVNFSYQHVLMVTMKIIFKTCRFTLYYQDKHMWIQVPHFTLSSYVTIDKPVMLWTSVFPSQVIYVSYIINTNTNFLNPLSLIFLLGFQWLF